MITVALAIVAVWVVSMLKGPKKIGVSGKDHFLALIKESSFHVDLKGIDDRMIAAVAMVETGNGTGNVFKNTNNLFSITAGKSWNGITYRAATGFVFRVYNSLEDSIRDFVRLISTSKIYTKAYEKALFGNHEGFFIEIQRAGYAGNDVDYAKKLLRVWGGLH